MNKKDMELSCKALGAAMFLGIICAYIAIGAAFAFVSGTDFYYHVSFAFLIQGIAVSMIASAAWVLCFSLAKSWSFLTRYLLVLTISAALFATSMLIPAINATEGLIWLISGIISTFSFGTGVAILSSKHFKNTGARSTLLWELN